MELLQAGAPPGWSSSSSSRSCSSYGLTLFHELQLLQLLMLDLIQELQLREAQAPPGCTSIRSWSSSCSPPLSHCSRCCLHHVRMSRYRLCPVHVGCVCVFVSQTLL